MQMCEWLSRWEWCDVRLLCGGRAFRAHRAVLASVSSFLRRILLSCPTEDTPTLIVLPDFDLEAMSAVLYYIYNGEVSMPKQKLEKFLEIIKAMQIFIDLQVSTQGSVNAESVNFELKRLDKRQVFILRSENDDTQFVTCRKRFNKNVCLRNADETDCPELTQAPLRNRNESFRPCLENLRSVHGDRQREYILRDSFTETYPRNRNTNGLAAGVPAIPNGCYRAAAAASAHLTNANASGFDDAVTAASSKTGDPASRLRCNYKLPNKHFHNPYLGDLMLANSVENFQCLATTKYDTACINGTSQPSTMILNVVEPNNLQTVKRAPYLDLSVIKSLSNSKEATFISYSTNKVMIESCDLSEHKDSSISNKVAIFNKALKSPWCPHLPDSFRPFRRKNETIAKTPHIVSRNKNDDNNNVRTLPVLIGRESNGNHIDSLIEPSKSGNMSSSRINIIDDSMTQDITVQALSNDESASSARQSSGRYTCTECGKSFSQLRNFKYHMSVHRGTKEFAASCTVCGKCFNDRGYLSSHMKIHRNRKEYKCSQCPKSFNQRVAYNMHVRIHTGVKPHVCDECGKAFSRKMLLKQHQRTHSGERPYACPHCARRFADRSNMTLHLRLHSGIKPFKCPMCPKSFTKKHHLKSHVNFHTGAKPYSCPRCKLAFTQSSNMRTHLKRCTAPHPEDP